MDKIYFKNKDGLLVEISELDKLIEEAINKTPSKKTNKKAKRRKKDRVRHERN